MSYKNKGICIYERSYSIRPIELLKNRGSKGLSDYDLVALIIGSSSNKPLHSICSNVIELINTQKENLTIKMIQDKTGLPINKASSIIAALELGRRKCDKSNKVIVGPESLYLNLLHWANADQEHFIVANINGANELTDINVITIGLLNKTLVHPREVFKKAIESKSAAIIIAHNHPSGTLYPSTEDIRITKRLVKSGDILGIPVLDHIVFTSKGFFSFRQENIFPNVKDC